MAQVKEKENEIENITGKYETTVRKLKTELDERCQEIQSLRAEKVKFYLYILLHHVYQITSLFWNCIIFYFVQ